MSRPAPSLPVACAFLEPREERLERLRAAARATPLDDATLRALELHGILPLAARNLRLAGAAPADGPAERLAERERALREEGLRNGLTLERLLDALADAGVEVTLLKGASLALDLWPDPLLRSQGDVDVLVARGDLRRAVRAAADAGLVEPAGALPIWWYRAQHFHLKLEPLFPMLKEVELHWRLHHPSLLVAVRHEALVARRVAVEHAGRGAFALDPLDRYLHLATHLASHWVSPPDDPARALATDGAQPPAVRLKWLVDLAAEAERLADEGLRDERGSDALLERAREWGAERELALAAGALDALGMLDAGGRTFLAGALTARAPRATPRGAPSAGDHTAARPLAGLDFRREALARWPRWCWPPAAYWRARLPAAGSARRLAARLAHALGVVGRSAAALVTLPVALAGRVLVRGRRAARRCQARAPERVLDLVVAWRARLAAAAGGAAEDATPRP